MFTVSMVWYERHKWLLDKITGPLCNWRDFLIFLASLFALYFLSSSVSLWHFILFLTITSLLTCSIFRYKCCHKFTRTNSRPVSHRRTVRFASWRLSISVWNCDRNRSISGKRKQGKTNKPHFWIPIFFLFLFPLSRLILFLFLRFTLTLCL